MGKFIMQQELRKEVREKDKVRREKLASYFYDVSKLIIVGVVLGGITPVYSNDYLNVNYFVVAFGTLAVIFFAWIGNKILK